MKPLLLSLFAASGRLNRLRNPLVACLGISVLYVIANIFFMGDVIHLIRGAANPFFASLIVVTTVITQVLTIYHAIKLSGETDLVLRIKEAMRGAAQDVQEKQHAVLAQILGTTKNAKSFAAWTLFSSLDSQRSAAQGYDLETLRTHLTAFEDQVARRASFPMHLSNTLIGLGLFGTFLGLIVTLKEVAGLIGLFAAAGNVDSADMMGQFFQKMSGPLAGMGEAFVASLLGLGGSIVTGMQLLSLKKIQSVTNYAAELSYFEVTETIYGPTTTGNDGKGVALDVRLAQLQLEEISALRHDITKQTDAILMASSKMRQASEAMNQVMNSLEKIATQDNIRPNIDQMTVLLDQRLETIVRKLDDTQNVQHGLLSVAKDSGVQLVELNKQNNQLIQHGAASVNQLTTIQATLYEHASLARRSDEQAEQNMQNVVHSLVGLTQQMAQLLGHAAASVSEVGVLRNSMIETSSQAQETGRQQMEALSHSVHNDLSVLTVAVAELGRVLREQNQTANDISSNTKQMHLQVGALEASTRHMFNRVQPQIVEMIARLEKADQFHDLVVKHDWAELHQKMVHIQESIKNLGRKTPSAS